MLRNELRPAFLFSVVSNRSAGQTLGEFRYRHTDDVQSEDFELGFDSDFVLDDFASELFESEPLLCESELLLFASWASLAPFL